MHKEEVMFKWDCRVYYSNFLSMFSHLSFKQRRHSQQAERTADKTPDKQLVEVACCEGWILSHFKSDSVQLIEVALWKICKGLHYLS